jgi:hypothetical protein
MYLVYSSYSDLSSLAVNNLAARWGICGKISQFSVSFVAKSPQFGTNLGCFGRVLPPFSTVEIVRSGWGREVMLKWFSIFYQSSTKVLSKFLTKSPGPYSGVFAYIWAFPQCATAGYLTTQSTVYILTR